MIALPASLAEIESLVRNQIPESIHLDYKASPALVPKKGSEIAKDVSALANSDGGLLIYGVEEDNASHLPVKIDSGVDPKWNREWLEQIINSNINPRIEGIEIRQFALPSGNSVICVHVSKSFRGPHQASDNKYYKRFNFSSFPMEHYEVEDARSRRQVMPSLVALDLGAPGGGLFEFELQNIGQAVALDVAFKWPDGMKWEHGTPPEQFVRGIKFLPPRKTLHIPYFGVFALLKEKDVGDDPKFDIEVTYTHGETGKKLTESFHFEPADLRGTVFKQSDVEKQGREIGQRIQELTRAVEKLSKQMETLGALAEGTGLQLSVTTLKNLRHLLAGKSDIERISARHCRSEVFQEVLGVDFQLAWRLQHYFRNESGKKLEEVEGMTPELVQTFRKCFAE
jgi:hypothetical protein